MARTAITLAIALVLGAVSVHSSADAGEGMGLSVAYGHPPGDVYPAAGYEDERVGWLGITAVSLNSRAAEQFDLELVSGVVVLEVKHESPAWRGDVSVGDVILRVGQEHIADLSDFARARSKHLRQVAPIAMVVERGASRRILVIRPEREPGDSAPFSSAGELQQDDMMILAAVEYRQPRFSMDHDIDIEGLPVRFFTSRPTDQYLSLRFSVASHVMCPYPTAWAEALLGGSVSGRPATG